MDQVAGKTPSSINISLFRTQAVSAVADPDSRYPVEYNSSTGTFEIRNVIPGTYSLNASVQNGGDEPVSPETLADVKKSEDILEVLFLRPGASAQMPIDMPASDLNNVVLTLSRGHTIPVRLAVEGDTAVKGIEEIRVALLPPSGSMSIMWRISTRFNPEGAARIDGVLPGEYRVSVDMPPSIELYVKEIRYERTDVLADRLLIPEAPSGALNIVLSSKGGQIEGTLLDSLSQTVNTGEVVLIPDQRDRKDLYRQIRSDHNGHFTFRAVPPGGYRVFAWEALERNAYYDREVISRYETQGKPVRIQESSKETIDLKIISEQR